MAETWAKLSGKISEKDMKILQDNIYIDCHKKTSKELEDEIGKMRDEIKRLKLRNDNLQHQIPLLKMDYERNFNNIPTSNKALLTSLHHLSDIQKQQTENSHQLNEKYSQHKHEFQTIKSLYELQTPEYKVYTDTVTLLKQLEIHDKSLSQELSDFREIIAEKKKIQREIFHKKIVNFVKTVLDYQGNVKVLFLIKKKMQEGNILLKAYEEKCKRIEMEKRGVKNLFNNMQEVLPLVSGKLPSICKLTLAKPSPTMSVCSFKSTKKYSLGAADLNKMKERELERMRLLKKLSLNEKIFTSNDDGLQKKYPKLDSTQSPGPSKLQNNLINDSLGGKLGRKMSSDLDKKPEVETVGKKRSIKINYNLENVKKIALDPPKKIEILENITLVKPKNLSQENKESVKEKQEDVFKQPKDVNASPFFTKGIIEAENPFVEPKAKDDEIFKVPYDTSFEMKYNQDYSFEDGTFLTGPQFEESSPFSPPQLITPETEMDETNVGFADFPFGEKRTGKSSFFSFK